jgi:hypothetical protein
MYNYGQKTKTGFKRWMRGDVQELSGQVDVYRTYFRYPDNTTDIKGYQGAHYSDFFPIDIDNSDLAESFAIFCEYAKVFKESRWYFSGAKGFHIEVPAAVFGYKESLVLYKEFKEYARQNLASCDMQIYDISRLWRVVNTINSKTGLYKIQLGQEDIDKGLDHILEKAKRPGKTWNVMVTTTMPWVTNSKPYKQAFTGGTVPDGERHKTVVSMIGYLLQRRVDKALIVNIIEAMPLEDSQDFDREKIGKMVMSMARKHQGQFAVNSKTGQILNTISNYCLAIEKLGHKLAYDDFLGKLTLNKVDLKDVDIIRIRRQLEDNYGLGNKTLAEDSANLKAHDNTVNCLQDYLNGLKWDGVERAETLFIDTLGAKDTPYVRKATRVNLVGAVMRALDPGCKHDTMIVLVGGQGIGKSTLIRKLACGWYNTAPLNLANKDSFIGLKGSWILEFAEMATYCSRNADLNRFKEYLAKQEDKYRAPYETFDREHKRHSIFIGSTNHADFLRDDTGERRFHPIPVSTPNWDLATPGYINQIWAEVITWYKAKELNYFVEESEEYNQVIKAHKEVDEREYPIIAFLEGRNEFSMGEVLDALGYSKDKLGDRMITRQVGALLRKHGFDRKVLWEGNKAVKKWIKI